MSDKDKQNEKECLMPKRMPYKPNARIPNVFGDPGINTIHDLEMGVTRQLDAGEMIWRAQLKIAKKMVSN